MAKAKAGRRLCEHCHRCVIPQGDNSCTRTLQHLKLCHGCYKNPAVREARWRAVGGRRPSGRAPAGPGEAAPILVLTELDASLSALSAATTELEASARAAAEESRDLVERSRRFAVELRERSKRCRNLAAKLDRNVRESNAELRRQAKAVGETRSAIRQVTNSLPAVDHGPGPGKEKRA